MSNRKKIGLIGCGAVADYGHIPAILNVPELELYAIFDPDEKTLLRIQKKYGIFNAYTDPDLFFHSGIESVSITSPDRRASCRERVCLYV